MEQQGPDFYDRMHAGLDVAATRTRYDTLFRKIIDNIRDHGSRSILEVGCGSGFLARTDPARAPRSLSGFRLQPRGDPQCGGANRPS